MSWKRAQRTVFVLLILVIAADMMLTGHALVEPVPEAMEAVVVEPMPEPTPKSSDELVVELVAPNSILTDTPGPQSEAEPEPSPVPAPEPEPSPIPTPEPEQPNATLFLAIEPPAPEVTPESPPAVEPTNEPHVVESEGLQGSEMPPQIDPVAPKPEQSPEPEPVTSEQGDGSEDAQMEGADGSGLRILPRKPRLDWTGLVPAEDGGLRIPRLYQYDYKTVLCKYDGIPRSVMTSGCNVTSVAMVAAYLTDEKTSPEVMFKWAVRNGLYFGDGLGHEQMSKVADHWGVGGRWINNDRHAVIAALREGKPVIAHMGPGLFTSRGHYIVLRGVTEDGKILVNDSNSARLSKMAFPMKTILRQTRTGQSFMVCEPKQKTAFEKDRPE